MYDIMIAGHLCLDIIPRFHNTGAKDISAIMSPGKLVNVQAAMISTGGPVSNTGQNIKKLGANVCFSACVGDDTLARITTDILRNSGNADGVKILGGRDSSYTVVIAPPGIDRIFLHNPGTNDFFKADYINVELLRECKHFHFGYPPLMESMFDNDGDELQKVFKIAKQAGATTSLDMALPDPQSNAGKVNWRKILEKTLPYVDIYLPSIEETYYMLYPQEFLKMKQEHGNAELIDYFTQQQYSALADEVLAMGTKMVTLKSGHRGYYIKTAHKDTFATFGAAKPGDPDNWSKRELWSQAFVVPKFGSATGSGDSSIAGFLAAYLRGLSIEQALKYATCCGWHNVQVLDAVSGMKSWDETTEILKRNMPMIDIHCKDKNWTFNDECQIWFGPDDKSRA